MAQTPVEICLERGSTGLGFNVKGGIDLPVFPGDSSIYVATIKPQGAAARDKRLQEGDKIAEVNGFKFDRTITHQAAVSQFLGAGDSVRMLVVPGEERRMATLNQRRQESGHLSTVFKFGCVAVVITAVVAGAAVLYMRLRTS